MSPASNRLQNKLAEQLDFLNSSAHHFDQGKESEAIRMSAALRVLFYDKPSSHSLLQQCGLDETKMFSSLSSVQSGWKTCLKEKIDLKSTTPVTMIPQLEFSRLNEVSFATWWEDEEIFRYNNISYSRKRIVLSMAHKDGGAHVDRLEEYYLVISSGKWAIGVTGNLTYEGQAPFPQGVTIFPTNAHLALIRQFAFEVVSSAQKYAWVDPVSV
jgi:hypothetical protein